MITGRIIGPEDEVISFLDSLNYHFDLHHVKRGITLVEGEICITFQRGHTIDYPKDDVEANA